MPSSHRLTCIPATHQPERVERLFLNVAADDEAVVAVRADPAGELHPDVVLVGEEVRELVIGDACTEHRPGGHRCTTVSAVSSMPSASMQLERQLSEPDSKLVAGSRRALGILRLPVSARRRRRVIPAPHPAASARCQRHSEAGDEHVVDVVRQIAVNSYYTGDSGRREDGVFHLTVRRGAFFFWRAETYSWAGPGVLCRSRHGRRGVLETIGGLLAEPSSSRPRRSYAYQPW